MALTVTVAQLADALGTPKDDAGAISSEDSAELTRLLAYANALITAEAPEAPDAYKDLATQALVGYLYDRPTSERGTGYANAWTNSGASAILKRYIQRRVFTLDDVAGAATSIASGSLNPDAVNDAIAQQVTGVFVVALLTALQANERLSLDATQGTLNASRITGLSEGSSVTDAHIKSLIADFAETSNPALVPSDKVGPVLTDENLTIHASRTGQRLTDLEELDTALRRSVELVDYEDLNVRAGTQAYDLGANVPSARADDELEVTVAGFGTATIELDALLAKPKIDNTVLSLSSANSVTFGLTNAQDSTVTFYLARNETSQLRFSADTVGTYDVLIRLQTIDIALFARPSDNTLIAGTDLAAAQRLPAPENDKWLKWASGALVNTDAPSGGGGAADSFVRTLRDGVLGLAIVGISSAVQQPLTALATPYTYGADDHGIFLVSVTWSVASGSEASLALGDDVHSTEQLYLSDLRATDAYLGGTSARNGLVASTVEVFGVTGTGTQGDPYVRADSFKNGDATLYLAHDSAGQVGTYMAYSPGAHSRSGGGSLQAQVKVTLLRSDYTAASGGAVAAATPTLVFEVAPASGFITDFAKSATETTGWGAATEAERVAALDAADWIFGYLDRLTGEEAHSGTIAPQATAFPFSFRNPAKKRLPAMADVGRGSDNNYQRTYSQVWIPIYLQSGMGRLLLTWGWAYNTRAAYTQVQISASLTANATPANNIWKRFRLWTL